MVQKPENESARKSNYPINPLILNRWSPRSMTGEELGEHDIMSLFEAARWAPSSFNNQPWRFIYAKRNTGHWDRLFNLLVDANKLWAKNAALLIVVISRKNFEYNEQPARTHQLLHQCRARLVRAALRAPAWLQHLRHRVPGARCQGRV